MARITDKASLAEHLLPNGKRKGRELREGYVSINLDRGVWHDHYSGEGGDLVDFIAQREGTDVRGVVDWLSSEGWIQPSPRQDLAAGNTVPPRKWFYSKGQEIEIEPLDEPRLHVYRRADGLPVLVMARYLTAAGKELRPFTWRDGGWDVGGTRGMWLPLYNLPQLVKEAARAVLVVEGEKAAEAAAQLPKLSGYVVTCPVGGSNPRKEVDWSPLSSDRIVHVSGDADRPGRSFMRKVCELVPHAQIIRPERLYRALGGEGDPPDGWDVADAVSSPGVEEAEST